MRLAILGFGLIGGSVARALESRVAGDWTVAAWSPTGTGPARAVADGVITLAAPDASTALDGAELVLLAAPPLACLELIDELGGALRSRLEPGAVVTDAASTKRRIVERATALGLPFVGGHPMAGLETTGYDVSDADLFVGRPWIVCPEAYPDGASRVDGLARAVGAEPLQLDADAHDAAVASVSHLPLVLAAALVEAILGGLGPDSAAARRLAAGGWSSMTRLARGDVEMATGIAATNADHLAARLRVLHAVIAEWLVELERDEPDPAALRRRFGAARDLLE